MTQSLKEYLISNGFTPDSDPEKSPYKNWHCSNFDHGHLIVYGDSWDSEIFFIYDPETEEEFLKNTRSMIVGFLNKEWDIHNGDYVWEQYRMKGAKIIKEKLVSKTLRAKSYVRHYCILKSLDERQKEYDEKYSDYEGWQVSGYNKYYQYRATTKRFLIKNATERDLILMKAIIEEALSGKS